MKKLIFLVPLLLVLSCSKEMNQDFRPEETNPSSTTTITLPKALSYLNSMIEELSCTTKTNSNYNLDDVYVVGISDFGTNTKSCGVEIPDTLMYIINFSDDGGFAVLSGDTRLSEHVYCLTESGSINCENFKKAYDRLLVTNTKSGLDEGNGVFYDMGEDFVPMLILSSILSDLKYGAIQDSETKAATVATNGTALLETKWTQWAPFNTYTPVDESSNRHCPTGCVATACAQIMEYCKKPANPVFDGVSCSWSDMGTVCNYKDLSGFSATASAKEQVARFLYHIGKKQLCNIRYAIDGSGGYADGVVRTLKNYGYSKVKKHTGFGTTNQSKASQMLRDGKPVYLDGSDYHNGGGHAWVIDGEWNGYFHCNWGWNGKWDGYYAKHNYFPVSSRKYIDSIDPGTEDSSVSHYDFDWYFRMVTYSL